QKRQVLGVLAELGVVIEEARDAGIAGEDRDEDAATLPIIELWNKWDLLPPERRDALRELAGTDENIIPISAITGMGVDDLTTRLGEVLTGGARLHSFRIPASDGARIAW